MVLIKGIVYSEPSQVHKKAEVILLLHPIMAQHQTDDAGTKIFELLPVLPESYEVNGSHIANWS